MFSPFIEAIEALPLANTPEVFGLHPNAEIGYYTQAARDMWAHLLELQPQTGKTQKTKHTPLVGCSQGSVSLSLTGAKEPDRLGPGALCRISEAFLIPLFSLHCSGAQVPPKASSSQLGVTNSTPFQMRNPRCQQRWHFAPGQVFASLCTTQVPSPPGCHVFTCSEGPGGSRKYFPTTRSTVGHGWRTKTLLRAVEPSRSPQPWGDLATPILQRSQLRTSLL